MIWKWKEADWTDYEARIAQASKTIDTGSGTIVEVEDSIRKTILEAAYKSIGLKVIRTRNGTILNEEIKKNIEERDRMMKENQIDWDAVKTKDNDIKEKIKGKKAEVWKNKVHDHSNIGKMWGLLKSLKGGKTKNDADRILLYRGKGHVSKRSKANAFVAEYASVSKIHIPKEYSTAKKKIANRMRQMKGVPKEEEQTIRLKELKEAIDDMDGSKAAGPDMIHPRLLKNLPKEGQEMILGLMNRSLTNNEIPQNWKTGKIVPILKKDKPIDNISSYRPICLTSCLGKIMERILNKRIMFCLES